MSIAFNFPGVVIITKPEHQPADVCARLMNANFHLSTTLRSLDHRSRHHDRLDSVMRKTECQRHYFSFFISSVYPFEQKMLRTSFPQKKKNTENVLVSDVQVFTIPFSHHVRWKFPTRNVYFYNPFMFAQLSWCTVFFFLISVYSHLPIE